MTEILTETATLKLFQSVHNYDGCFQDSFNLLQMISQPFINGFCFNMGHLNELQLVIRMSEYSLREEVIRIFESFAGNPNHRAGRVRVTRQVRDLAGSRLG